MPPEKNRIAIVQQVLRRDGRRDTGARARDEFHRARGGDVLEHHLEFREPLEQRREHLVDEARFAVEDIDVRVAPFRRARSSGMPSSSMRSSTA